MLDQVDENYFLKDSYFEDKSHGDIENLGIGILVNSLSEEELASWLTLYQNNISLLTVTSYEMINSGDTYVGKFSVDGVLAFCLEHYSTTPRVGSPTSNTQLVTNEGVRKALYYGYAGPGQLSGLGTTAGFCATSVVASHYYSGSRIYWDQFAAGGQFCDMIENLPNAPSNFKVYAVDTNGNSTQDLAYWKIEEEEGYLNLKKKSLDVSVSENNPHYTLEGAVYGVYEDATLTKKVGELMVNKDGNSNTLKLKIGQYWIKELVSPTGYELDPTIYSVKINANTTITKEVYDQPKMVPIDIILTKKSSENLPNPIALGNAHFQIDFYKGDYDEALDITPDKSWVVKTLEDGSAKLNEDCKISGDDFYIFNNQPALSMGTLVIQEIQAPIGYQLNTEKIIKKIELNASGMVVFEDIPVILENPIHFKIKKMQKGAGLVVGGVSFMHTHPDGSTNELVTDDEGEVTLYGLEAGVHKLREIKTIDGLILNGHEFVFEVLEDGTTKSLTSITEDMGFEFNLDINHNGSLVVLNEVAPFQVKVIKVNDEDKMLDGAEFTLYDDQECLRELMKRETVSGCLFFEGLEVDKKYYLKETKPPIGYRPLIGVDSIYEIYFSSTKTPGVFDCYVNGEKIISTSSHKEIYLEGNPNDKTLVIEIVNEREMKLPVTGDDSVICLLTNGTLLFVLGCVSYTLQRKGEYTYEQING